MDMQLLKVRVRATGQVLDMVPSVARQMLDDPERGIVGTIELVEPEVETASIGSPGERAEGTQRKKAKRAR